MRARRWFEPDCGQTTHDMSRRALEQPRSVAEAQLLQERLRDQAIWTIPCAGMNHRGQIDRIPVRQPDTIVRLCFFDSSWFRRPMNSIRSFFPPCWSLLSAHSVSHARPAAILHLFAAALCDPPDRSLHRTN